MLQIWEQKKLTPEDIIYKQTKTVRCVSDSLTSMNIK